MALFSDLEEQAVKTVTAFLDFYARAVCISANRHLEGMFAEELDFCLALDFNKTSPQGSRTQIGDWEYHAKYHQDKEATTDLGKVLCLGFRWLPWRHISKPRLVTFIPCDPQKKVYLPRTLAGTLVKEVREAFWGTQNPLFKAELTKGKKSAKNLTFDQKIAQWEEIVDGEAIALSRSVQGCSVVVLDDLYQSGASLWSFAKYLKGKGASTVVGLACVKSLRDTDNQ